MPEFTRLFYYAPDASHHYAEISKQRPKRHFRDDDFIAISLRQYLSFVRFARIPISSYRHFFDCRLTPLSRKRALDAAKSGHEAPLFHAQHRAA